MAFGAAYLEAYHLESKVALHPRIILSRRAAEFAQDAAKSGESWQTEFIRKFLRRDHDGIVYIEIFDDPQVDPIFSNVLLSADGRQSYAGMLRGLVDVIEREIAKALASNRPDIYSKYRWFATRLNNCILHLAPHLGENRVPPVNVPDDRGGDIPIPGPE